VPLSLRSVAVGTVAVGSLMAMAVPAFAGWGMGTAISGSAHPTNGSIAVAPLPGADALAVFADSESNDVLWQRFDASSSAWLSAPGLVASSADRTAGTALAAFTEGGVRKVRAVWRSGPYDSSNGNTIMTSVFDAATDSWTTAEAVSGQGGAWGEAPEVAVAGGETYVTWDEAAPSGSLRISRLESDSTWGTTTLAPVGGLARNVQVVVDPGGNATAIWTVDGSAFVWVSQRPPGDGSSWSPPAHLAEPDVSAGFSDSAGKLVVDSAGVLTAAFTRVGRDESNNVVSRDIYATRYDPGAQSPAWTAAGRVSRSGESSFEPQLGVAPDDAVTLAWDAAVGAIADGPNGVLASRFDPSDQSPAWTTPDVIVEGSVFRPLGVTPVGSATIITWIASDGLRAVRRSEAGAWSAPALVAAGQSLAVASTSTDSAMFAYATGAFDDSAQSFAGASARYLEDSGSGPGVPQDVTASPDRNAIAVRYSPPANLGYWGAATYRVTASPGGATCTSAGTTCRFTGLDAHQEYTFTVVADGPGGASAASTPSNATAPGGATAPSSTRLWWGNWGYGLNGLSMSTATGAYGETVVPGIAAWGLAADPARGRIYLLDLNANAIKWVNADGTGSVQTLTTAHSPQEGLSVDTTAGRAYWTTTTDSIAWASIEDPAQGGELYTSADAAVRAPKSVAVDPPGNRIYWANGTDGTVGYGNLQTAGDPGVITLGGCPAGLDPTSAIGVAVDPGSDALYVAARTSSAAYAVLKARMDGSSCAVLASGSAEILGLAVDTAANRVFYAWDSALGYVDITNPGTTTNISTAALVDYPGFPMLFGLPTGTASLSASGTTAGATLTCAVAWAPDAPGRGMYQAPEDATIAWQRDGASVPGTGATLVAESAGSYRCAATGVNAAGGATTRSSEVTISPQPSPDSTTSDPSGSASSTPGQGANASRTVEVLSSPSVVRVGKNRSRITFRLRLTTAGRYAFILQRGSESAQPSLIRGDRKRRAALGSDRVEFLRGSRIGRRTLASPSSAPVLQRASAGQAITIVAIVNDDARATLVLNAVAGWPQAGLRGSAVPVP